MKFSIKDKVKFEWRKDKEKPRWDLGNDHGPSGVYGEGEVTELALEKGSDFAIKYTNYKGVAGVWKFTYKDVDKPGFPILIPNEEQKKNMDALRNWLTNG